MMRPCIAALVFTFVVQPLDATEMVCPLILKVHANAQVPAAWVSFDTAENGEHPFDFAEFSDGSPQSQALLLPDEADKKYSRVLTYNFYPSQQPWLICSYADTSITLSQRLPAGTRQCRITLDKHTDYKTAKTIDCH